ncbi:MAG: hypothetical protein K0S24_3111 [Sphingobacterium sp.]|jgi:hypothetical protein|nr:hypothetical protein [Sphingobacterium sp.]
MIKKALYTVQRFFYNRLSIIILSPHKSANSKKTEEFIDRC